MNQSASGMKHRCRVVNIGPDVDVRRLLTEFLKTYDCVSIRHIETGTIGLDILGNLPESDIPDIVIVPFRLPILTGLDFIVAMRSHGQLRAIPIIVWGPQMQVEEINEMYGAGATCVLPGKFNATHVDGLKRFVFNTTGVSCNVAIQQKASRAVLKQRPERGRMVNGNARLGTLFTLSACVSIVLWMLAFLQFGNSYETIDLAPLPVYASLAFAGLSLMGSPTIIEHTRKTNSRRSIAS
jgi:CheY-like chemotaxis protein